MSNIKEGDWVVTKDVVVGTRASLEGRSNSFEVNMILVCPRKVRPHTYTKGWWAVEGSYRYYYRYHSDWLIKVNQDGTPYKWSWLTELGWV